MKKLRAGVIGCGRIAAVYREAFAALEDMVEVCYAVDKAPERAKAFADHFPGCAFSSQLEDLLAQPLDVVHILTPHFLHREHAIACLKAGFHVLTEKPIAIALEDADAMIQAAKDAGKQLGVIFQNRYIEGIQEAKRLIEAGAFGALTGAWSTLNWHRPPSYYECDWKGSWEKEGGGVVIDQAIHSIDLVRYLMGCEVDSIKGQIDRRILTSIEVEDVANAAIRYSNGAVHSFSACNYYVHNSPIRIEVCGEKGRMLLTETKVEIQLGNEPAYIVDPVMGLKAGGESYWGGYHLAQVRDFYHCLQQNKPVPVDPADAAKTLAVVLGIYQSAKENRTVYF